MCRPGGHCAGRSHQALRGRGAGAGLPCPAPAASLGAPAGGMQRCNGLEANADNGIGASVSSGTEPEQCSPAACSGRGRCAPRPHHRGARCVLSSAFHTLEQSLPGSSLPLSSAWDGPLDCLGVGKIIPCGKCPSGFLWFQWVTRTAQEWEMRRNKPQLVVVAFARDLSPFACGSEN